MDLFSHACPCCTSEAVHVHTRYKTQAHGNRTIYHCRSCDIYYSETFATPIAGLTTPLSRIIGVLTARTEGMSLNATARTFKVSKKSVIDWEHRLGELKPTLILYALLHEFIHQEIEGDELYTKVDKNVPASASEGWTIVLMERGSRFLWELHCGRKEKQLFERALKCLAEVIEQTGSISLLTDGERRYGNLLFEICHDVLRTGATGATGQTVTQRGSCKVEEQGVEETTRAQTKKSTRHPCLNTQRPSIQLPTQKFMLTM